MLRRLWELTTLFLKLGMISFGGPAAHIAIMDHEVVQRRGWLSREHFTDLLAATNLIPGPNSTEMANHVGYQRAGVLGAVLAGLCFTLPAALISGMCAVGYVRFGSLPQVEPLLAGIKPAVWVVVVAAVVRLGKQLLRSWQTALIGGGVSVASLLGVDEILALLLGGLLGVLLLRFSAEGRKKKHADAARKDTSQVGSGGKAVGLLGAAGLSAHSAAAAERGGMVGAGAALGLAVSTPVPLWQLGLFFLKVGAVLYGSGYVLIAYLEGGLVQDYGWLSQQQLIDAVAVGQFTPGPLLSTATFIGYLVAGVPGAAVATVAILLPSFVFVIVVNPWIPRLRGSLWAARFLDAVGAASIGLMGAVAVTLGQAAISDWRSGLIAASVALALWRWQLGPAWLVAMGAIGGWLLSW